MLERPINQAAGLLTLAGQHDTKLIAMVSHGDGKNELPLLWRLCTSMVQFGYSVTVLDATTRETANNPGWEQLLQYNYWHSNDHSDAPEWTVIPACNGMQTLCAKPGSQLQGRQLLGNLFQDQGVVVLYGDAQLVAPLLCDSTVKPLLAVAPLKTSLITSYRALKQLLLKGRLEPTIVNLTHESKPVETATKIGTVAASLSDCARNFLGYEVNAVNISTLRDDDRPSPELQRLAMYLLEYALPLQSDFAGSSRYPSYSSATATFAGRH